MTDTFQQGQVVILRTPSYRAGVAPSDKEVTVERVARKYVYVRDGWQERAFDRETGRERGESNYPCYIGTAEMFAERDRLIKLQMALSASTRDYGWVSRLSVEQIEGILAILKVEADQ